MSGIQRPDPRPAASRTGKQLRVLTVNVQHASPERSRAQAAWLAAQPGLGVVALTEVGHGPGRTALLAALKDYGFHTLAPPVPDPRDYSTVLAARLPLEPLPVDIDPLGHRIAAATVQTGRHRATVVSLYVPSRGPRARRNVDKRAFQHAVAAALPDLVKQAGPTSPLVVTGDLNVVEPGHHPYHAVFGTWEYDFYRAFATAGLRDAFRHLHPDTVEHSWYGRSGAGYRFDHLFISDAHAAALSDCRYLHTPRTLGLSDHAALLAAIRLP